MRDGGRVGADGRERMPRTHLRASSVSVDASPSWWPVGASGSDEDGRRAEKAASRAIASGASPCRDMLLPLPSQFLSDGTLLSCACLLLQPELMVPFGANALLLSTHRFLARPIEADPEPANGRDGNRGGQQTDANPLDDRRHGTSSRRNAFLEQCVHRRRTFDMVLESGEDITHDADELVLTAGEHVDRHLRPLGDVPIQGPSDEPTVQSDERQRRRCPRTGG